MPPETTDPLYDVAATENTLQDSLGRKAGKAMFVIGGATFVWGSLWVLLASMLQHPEGANMLWVIAAAWLLAQVPPSMLGHLPD